MSNAPTNDEPKRDNTSSGTSNLSREKIQQLLAAVGSKPAEDTTQIEAAEYNWQQPHRFSGAQLQKLDDFTKEVAAALAEKFALLCHNDFNVTISSTTEHFAAELIDQALENEQNNYYLAFGPDPEHLCGLISIPPQTATAFVTQLLGDSESEKDSSEGLSQLEESLLSDTASAIIQAASDSHNSCDFQPAEAIVRGQFPLELQGTEELCKITFSLEKTDSENPDKFDKFGEAHLLVLCDILEPVVGKTTQDAGGFSAKDISKAILNHLQHMSVSVTAQLSSTVLTFEQIMNLQVDDILLLDKRIDEPIELTVEGRTILHGQPAKLAGKYAVVIAGITNA
ncbi:MAG: FliM/FliN family flagellar motor switch protein [Planctomycetota bacterium]|jgi:flagellar motor switch protein FliM